MIQTLFLAIVVERITEVITNSEISNIVYKNKLKKYLYGDVPLPATFLNRLLSFIDKLTSCGYCCSVWVSAGINLISDAFFDVWLLDLFLVMGLSNLYHVIYELLRRGRINTYDLTISHEGRLDVQSSEQARDNINN